MKEHKEEEDKESAFPLIFPQMCYILECGGQDMEHGCYSLSSTLFFAVLTFDGAVFVAQIQHCVCVQLT